MWNTPPLTKPSFVQGLWVSSAAMNDAATRMRYLGVLSGVSYVSGLDYFKTINQRVGELIDRSACERMPKNARLVMACVDCDTYVDLLEKGDNAGCSRYLMEDGVDRLVAAGAEVLVIASNTAHLVCAAAIAKHPQLQVLHIADTTAAAIKAAGFAKVGLLGTKPTMEDGSWLKARLAAHGIEVVVPEHEAELRRCYDIICQELSLDVFTEPSRAFFVGLARALVAERGAQARRAASCHLRCTMWRRALPSAVPRVATSQLAHRASCWDARRSSCLCAPTTRQMWAARHREPGQHTA